jgi:hypothetical protein
MSEPLANMWSNWALLRKESFRAESEVAKAAFAMRKAVADIDETSRELKEMLERSKDHAVRSSADVSIEAQPSFEHSLPPAAMLNM